MIRRMLASSLLGLAAMGSLVGCAHPTNGTTAPLSQSAITDDPAMQRRDWTKTDAQYANGQVIADPTLWLYEPKRGMERQWYYYFADTGAFLASVFTMPIGLFDPGADADVIYPGRIIPASHYGVPPLHKRPCKCGKPADQCGNGTCNDDECAENASDGKCDSCAPSQPSPEDAPTIQPSSDDAPTIQPSPKDAPTIQPSSEDAPTIQPSSEDAPTMAPISSVGNTASTSPESDDAETKRASPEDAPTTRPGN